MRNIPQQDENVPPTPSYPDLFREISETLAVNDQTPRRISSVSACERCRERKVKTGRRQGCNDCPHENKESPSSPTRRRVRNIRQSVRSPSDMDTEVDSGARASSPIALGPLNRRPPLNHNLQLLDPTVPSDLSSDYLQMSEEDTASLLTTLPRYPTRSSDPSPDRPSVSISPAGSPSRGTRRRSIFSSNNNSPTRPGIRSMDSDDSVISDLFINVDYVNHEAVASGGFASVHVGMANGAKVAIKAVRMNMQNERVAKRRLSREIMAWKGLKHPNITPLIGIAYCPDLSYLEVMITPWYDNGSATCYLSSGIRDLRERLHLSLGVAKGIHYLHRLNPVVIHGDLKPSNVLIDKNGEPKICDFGLARIVNGVARSGLTTTTRHNSTPLYAAPEILLADDDAPPFEPSTASDIYSLGSLLYEFLTGRMPYANLSNNLQILCAIVKGTKPATRPAAATPAETLQWDLFEHCWMGPTERPDAFGVVAALIRLRDKACIRRGMTST